MTAPARRGLAYLTGICFVTTIGGFLFGYDTAVISGGIDSIQWRFQIGTDLKGWVAASAILGCIFGSASSGVLADRFGRKMVLILASILLLISAIGSMIPQSVFHLVCARLIGGLGVGITAMASPMYMSEVSPAHYRGRMVSLYQLAITLGIVCSFVINYFIASYGAAVDVRAIEPHLARQGSLVASERASQLILERAKYSKHVDENTLEPTDEFAQEIDELMAGADSTLSPAAMIEFLSHHEVAVAETDLHLDRFGITSWNVQRGWRLMFGAEAIPALLYLGLLLFVPESPRWLIKQGRAGEARRIMAHVMDEAAVERSVADVEDTLTHESNSILELLQPGFRSALILGVTLALIAQFSGINAVMYFGPTILKSVGFTLGGAMGGAVLIGVINSIFTFIAIWKVDSYGRRPLLLIGATGACLSLAGCAAAFGWLNVESLTGLLGALHLTGLFDVIDPEKLVAILKLLPLLTFCACFSFSLGPVFWVVAGEIFPTRVRGRAVAVATAAVWLGAFIVSQLFPRMLEQLDAWGSFATFATITAAGVVFIALFLPETKGRTLEEIEQSWLKGASPDGEQT